MSIIAVTGGAVALLLLALVAGAPLLADLPIRRRRLRSDAAGTLPPAGARELSLPLQRTALAPVVPLPRRLTHLS